LVVLEVGHKPGPCRYWRRKDAEGRDDDHKRAGFRHGRETNEAQDIRESRIFNCIKDRSERGFHTALKKRKTAATALNTAVVAMALNTGDRVGIALNNKAGTKVIGKS
jgi:hypothetical protein